jgi:hypothetical protein
VCTLFCWLFIFHRLHPGICAHKKEKQIWVQGWCNFARLGPRNFQKMARTPTPYQTALAYLHMVREGLTVKLSLEVRSFFFWNCFHHDVQWSIYRIGTTCCQLVMGSILQQKVKIVSNHSTLMMFIAKDSNRTSTSQNNKGPTFQPLPLLPSPRWNIWTHSTLRCSDGCKSSYCSSEKELLVNSTNADPYK